MHVTWVSNPSSDPTDESTKNIMQYQFYISDDRKHDSYFVQHYLELHLDSIVESGFTPKNRWISSDGYAGQFKSQIPWYFVSSYQEIVLMGVIVCGASLGRAIEKTPRIG